MTRKYPSTAAQWKFLRDLRAEGSRYGIYPDEMLPHELALSVALENRGLGYWDPGNGGGALDDYDPRFFLTNWGDAIQPEKFKEFDPDCHNCERGAEYELVFTESGVDWIVSSRSCPCTWEIDHELLPAPTP